MVFGRFAPVIRGARCPVKTGVLREMVQGFIGIGFDVGGKPHLPAQFQDTGKSVKKVRLDQSSLLLAFLWPRVRKQNEHTRDRLILQAGHNRAGIIHMQPHIGKLRILNLAERFGHAFDKRLAADKADA